MTSDPEQFAEWLRRRGQRVIRTQSSYWAEAAPLVFQAFPYHWVISPTEQELSQFITAQPAICLRFSTPVRAPSGAISYHIVLYVKDYDLFTLRKQARYNVRRGLRKFRIESIPFGRMADEGWILQQDTLDRQSRHKSLGKSDWEVLCRATDGLVGFEAWGATVSGRLAASAITFRMGDCYYWLYQNCLRQHMPDLVNNALCFSVTRNLISRPGTESILYTLQSLDAPSSVDEFKFHMGYSALPVRQRVVFHPWLRPFINPASHMLMRKVLHLHPDNYTFSKMEGMMRYYLQGI